MKKMLLVVMLCALCVPGCAAFEKISQSTEDFFLSNPQIDPLDMRDILNEDGELVAFGLDKDHNGKIDIDPETGKAFEVPGTRERLTLAGQTDSNIVELFALAALFIPGAGIAGRLWGKVNPTKQSISLIRSIQAIRDKAKTDPITLENITSILAAANAKAKGLPKLVNKIKFEIKSEG